MEWSSRNLLNSSKGNSDDSYDEENVPPAFVVDTALLLRSLREYSEAVYIYDNQYTPKQLESMIDPRKRTFITETICGFGNLADYLDILILEPHRSYMAFYSKSFSGTESLMGSINACVLALTEVWSYNHKGFMQLLHFFREIIETQNPSIISAGYAMYKAEVSRQAQASEANSTEDEKQKKTQRRALSNNPSPNATHQKSNNNPTELIRKDATRMSRTMDRRADIRKVSKVGMEDIDRKFLVMKSKGRNENIEWNRRFDLDHYYLYTDGSCSAGGKGGIGIYHEPKHHLNISEKVTASNSVGCEIAAVVRALKDLLDSNEHGSKKVVIRTDYQPLIERLKYIQGNSLPPDSIYTEIFELLQQFPEEVEFQHVYSHDTLDPDYGNVAADYLARSAIGITTSKSKSKSRKHTERSKSRENDPQHINTFSVVIKPISPRASSKDKKNSLEKTTGLSAPQLTPRASPKDNKDDDIKDYASFGLVTHSSNSDYCQVVKRGSKNTNKNDAEVLAANCVSETNTLETDLYLQLVHTSDEPVYSEIDSVDVGYDHLSDWSVGVQPPLPLPADPVFVPNSNIQSSPLPADIVLVPDLVVDIAELDIAILDEALEEESMEPIHQEEYLELPKITSRTDQSEPDGCLQKIFSFFFPK